MNKKQFTRSIEISLSEIHEIANEAEEVNKRQIKNLEKAKSNLENIHKLLKMAAKYIPNNAEN